MTDMNPTILLLEDTRTVQNYIRDVLRFLPMEHNLVVAKRIEEAQQLAAQNSISVFIVDIGLPDGDGIDFLCEMAMLHPRARALIITSTPRDDYWDRARQIGVLSFLPKPLQRKELLEAVSGLLAAEAKAESSGHSEQNGFEGTLGGLSPADIIQLKCLSRANGVIEFTTDERYGMVWFDNGEVIHAETEDATGKRSGDPAFQTIVAWKTGTVREVPHSGTVARTIRRSWQALLMDATVATETPVAAP
jgi:DNA-binding NarL/FixJ family response regulator